MKRGNGHQYTVQTVDRALTLLETCAEEPAGFTLTELSRRLRESPAVVFRIARTFDDRGYLQRDGASKRYSIGLRNWELGQRALSRTTLLDAARPILERLTEETGETAALAVVRGVETVYLDVVEGTAPIRVHAEVGSRIPLYLTASGRAILAYRDRDFFGIVVAAGMKPITAKTITTASELRHRLTEIRKTGLSVNRGERWEDLSAVAAPIFDARQECIAAVTGIVPTARFKPPHVANVTRAVRDAAHEISKKLGDRSAPTGMNTAGITRQSEV